MFEKILIANRGEIACRVIRTARRMGIATVAVFSDADRDALHVRLADEARRIGPPPARESYLDGEALIAAAKASGAEAIHPGYGFLSENEDFAAACGRAGLVFIGPSPAAIAAMGDKAAAKRLMEKASVPLVPGYHGEAQDEAKLAREAERIGYPVLIKPSAGGGGKGMRVVRKAGEFGILGQEAVAGMDRFRPGGTRGAQHRLDVEIGKAWCRRADQMRLVGHRDMQRPGIRFGVDRYGGDPHPPRRANDTAGDFAAIGDQNFGEHRRPL